MPATTDLGDRLPPHNIEFEQTVLSWILCGGQSSIDEIRTILRWEDMYRDSHQIICKACYDMHEAGKTVDLITVEEYLARRGLTEKVGGFDALAEISQRKAFVVPLYHAAIIREYSVAREAISIFSTGLRSAYEKENTEFFLDKVEADLCRVRTGLSTPKEQPAQTKVASVLEMLDRARKGEVIGQLAGIDVLDNFVCGFRGGQLTVLAGRPSMGKSALALNIAMFQLKMNETSFYSSLEMSSEELTSRMILEMANVDSHRINNGSVTDEEWKRVQEASEAFAALPPLIIDDTPSQTIQHIATSMRRAKSKHNISLAVIDYIQRVDVSGRQSEAMTYKLGEVSGKAKSLARELDIPVILVSQLNRAVEQNAGCVPTMANLKDSGAIEQDADKIILIHRPEYYDPRDRPGEADAIIAKNRGGRTGTVSMAFVRHITKFADLSPYKG